MAAFHPLLLEEALNPSLPRSNSGSDNCHTIKIEDEENKNESKMFMETTSISELVRLTRTNCFLNSKTFESVLSIIREPSVRGKPCTFDEMKLVVSKQETDSNKSIDKIGDHGNQGAELISFRIELRTIFSTGGHALTIIGQGSNWYIVDSWERNWETGLLGRCYKPRHIYEIISLLKKLSCCVSSVDSSGKSTTSVNSSGKSMAGVSKPSYIENLSYQEANRLKHLLGLSSTGVEISILTDVNVYMSVLMRIRLNCNDDKYYKIADDEKLFNKEDRINPYTYKGDKDKKTNDKILIGAACAAVALSVIALFVPRRR